METKVNIIGVNSTIGSFLYKKLKNKFVLNGTYFNQKQENSNLFLDITNFDSLDSVLPKLNHSTIILLSALKDVKKCEENYQMAYNLNTQPVDNMIKIIRKRGLDIRLIFFSSDYVFEGKTGNYNSNSPINPQTNYGRTKAEAETLLNNSKIDYKIIRLSAVMAPRSPFFSWLISSIKNETEIIMYNNVFFSPTPINFLSDMIESILKNYTSISDSVLHVVGEKRYSRFEFAKEIADILRINARLIPDEKDLSNSMFQYDLSMIQSDYVKKIQSRSVVEYLKDLWLDMNKEQN